MDQALFSLEARTALVTGGNGGLGRAMAFGLRAAGAHVVVSGRNAAKNAVVRAELGDGALVSLDVRDEAAVERTVGQVVERWGRLDILVNNAGLFRGGPVTDLCQEDWEAVLGTHLTGSFLCAKHAARMMRQQGEGGKIINIVSMYSLFGPPSYADYAAAKTGLVGLTRALAVELARDRIQVNAILPGWYPTDLTQGVQERPLGDQIRRRTPAGRWGAPEDLVGAVIFLASRASDFVTGVCLPVDGGYSVSDRLLYD